MEAIFKGVCPYASQLIVHGEGRSFVTALVTLDADAMATWAGQNAKAGMPLRGACQISRGTGDGPGIHR